MKETALIRRLPAVENAAASGHGALAGIWRYLVHGRLRALREGGLRLVEGGQSWCFGPAEPEVTLHVTDPGTYRAIACGGSVGAGEAYVRGEWHASDLTALVRLLLRNRSVLDGLEYGLARWSAPLRRALHTLARNTRRGSRRNIEVHYDFGNEFFALFLDASMTYSCAYYAQPDLSLEQAQQAKLERICRKLELKRGDRVIEIGTGWGAFAVHAALHHGCHVTTTTLSRAQFEHARARVEAAGVADRVTLLLDDYRDLRGTYDKLVSIEMIEAIGHQYFDTFFACCGRLLKPHGLMLLQAITIADSLYLPARDSVDFIKRHVFPGSCLPSVSALASASARTSDLRIVALEDIGGHYVMTLRAWRERLARALPRLYALGEKDALARLWEFYFCYCEGGFAEGVLGDVQILLAKSRARLLA